MLREYIAIRFTAYAKQYAYMDLVVYFEYDLLLQFMPGHSISVDWKYCGERTDILLLWVLQASFGSKGLR